MRPGSPCALVLRSSLINSVNLVLKISNDARHTGVMLSTVFIQRRNLSLWGER